MTNDTNIELEQDRSPLVGSFDKFTSRYLMHILAMLSYLAPLSLGLHYVEFLMQSPLISFSSKFVGFCASVISWVPAYLFHGIILGKFDFARDVYKLYSSSDFSIAIAFVFLITPIAIFIARSFSKITLSSFFRSLICCTAFVFLLASLVSIIEYTNSLENHYAYIFSFCVIGIIYFVVFVKLTETRTRRMSRRQQRQGILL